MNLFVYFPVDTQRRFNAWCLYDVADVLQTLKWRHWRLTDVEMTLCGYWVIYLVLCHFYQFGQFTGINKISFVSITFLLTQWYLATIDRNHKSYKVILFSKLSDMRKNDLDDDIHHYIDWWKLYEFYIFDDASKVDTVNCYWFPDLSFLWEICFIQVTTTNWFEITHLVPTQNFRKANISYSLIRTGTSTYEGDKKR